MKLIRFGAPGRERPGILDPDGARRDCSSHFQDWNHDFFDSDGLTRLEALVGSGVQLPRVSEAERHGPPVARPLKLIGIGLNYRDHAVEAGMPIPSEPVVFMKASNTIVGPFDTILIPRGSVKTDWEVELAIVIGRNARYLESSGAAAACIAGYCVSNDVSEREFQLERGGQWTKGKSCDTFNPLGPFLATPDELPDVRGLAMWLDVNGRRAQTGSTATMIFDPHFLVHYLSQFMTLEAGDVITTGTPPGVGLAMKPPSYLEPGDVVELGIEHLGAQRQVCGRA
jgi:2-keto-4-pentenoate hydratase/2-oxohepta-3-ene-1,7-dioic acid hydratase in catechol pathway